MLFNSLQFAVFFIIVYGLYLVLNHKWQNRMLLVASCIFYGLWDWRFLCLMFVSISVDYFCALRVFRSTDEKIRKRFLFISVGVNLLILGFFKYFNFFASSFQDLFACFGLSLHPLALNIILPVGISFYTFEAITYIANVYGKKIAPTTSYRDYALFVTYFPHLVAGPIMKAKDLLPQIQRPRTISLENCYEGAYLFFWGIFQKVFVADNLARVVDATFGSPGPYKGGAVLMAVYAFAFQIYCDFAGYSNMARGLGKVMGFDIMINFNLPYFSTNPREFWQRWHISLSTFLRDYLYIPLGGNQKGTLLTYRNLAITMLLGGLWHGAGWTYVLWGAYQGVLLIVHRLLQPVLERFRGPGNPALKNAWFLVKVIFFFQWVCLGWLIFRAISVEQVFLMMKGLFTDFQIADSGLWNMLQQIVFFTGTVVLAESFQYRKNDLLAILKINPVVRAAFYSVCIVLILLFGATNEKAFIYFQF